MTPTRIQRRSMPTLLTLFVLLALLTTNLLLPVPTAAQGGGAIVTVNTTTDNLTDGLCSLSEAITATNSNIPNAGCPHSGATGTDTIQFNIGGGGQQTIVITDTIISLPTIVAPLIIDGATQPGYTGVPLIELRGPLAGTTDGLAIATSGTTIRGLTINGFGNSGILILSGNNNTIQLNYIGTNPNGTTGRENGTGITIIDSINNTVGPDNLISGNGIGIQIINTNSTGNRIRGNLIGTNATGTAALPNTVAGIVMNSGARQNRIGGETLSDRNIISGNNGPGILLQNSGTVSNTIEGNYIGTSKDGLVRVPNRSAGILLDDGASNNIIGNAFQTGDPVGGTRSNLISGNNGSGVIITGTATIGNRLLNNRIGINATGLVALGNSGDGVRVVASGNIIGSSGSTSGEGNVIAGNAGDGINITAIVANTVVGGNRIGVGTDGTTALPNSGNGIQVNGSNNQIGGPIPQDNLIANNGGAGIAILAGIGNRILRNQISNNAALGIDLGGNGPTANDPGDGDTGPNQFQNAPVLATATWNGSAPITITGRIETAISGTVTIDLYAVTTCDPSGFGEGEVPLTRTTVFASPARESTFAALSTQSLPGGGYITAIATDAAGNSSEFSRCLPYGFANDAWTRALDLTLTGTAQLGRQATIQQYLATEGESRWYRFPIVPGSRVIVTLDQLPGDYDLALYENIAAAYTSVNSTADLLRLNAELPTASFNPDNYSPNALSGQELAPEAFTSQAFDPSSFQSAAFAPAKHSPAKHSPAKHSPAKHSPAKHSPAKHSPGLYDPSSYDPSDPSVDPDAYASAQSRSLLAISALDGTAPEDISVYTWTTSGYYYVRVQGYNGSFDPLKLFRLNVTILPSNCSAVAPIAATSTLQATAGNFKTVILTDLSRMPGTDVEKATLQARLATFAARPEVQGVVVNVAADARVAAARAQAGANIGCPYATNLLAEEIEDIVDRYRPLNPLEYVVLVGNDDVIPFFRYPDQASLGPESEYVPPVRNDTISEASLRLNYTLGQDAYGAQLEVSTISNQIPIPDLAVGRIVETAAEATGMLDAYLATADGTVPTPNTAFVSGYDFLADAAVAISNELGLALSTPITTLIADPTKSPADPSMWTAPDLRNRITQSDSQSDGFDLMYLAGHFSANEALAADNETFVSTRELEQATVNLENAIIFSNGCHSGYSIVNDHAITGLTDELDWAQAFSRKQATLIAGTGYQYGDTEFIEYGERLYLEFSRQLRTGTGSVAVGKALIEAKRRYLADTSLAYPLHVKTLQITALFGLPMTKVSVPGARLTAQSRGSEISSTAPFSRIDGDPGDRLGLRFADFSPTTSLRTVTKQLANIENNNAPINATYLAGPDGWLTNPAEPVLPLDIRNVSVPTYALRGVGFRGGTYSDQAGIVPLTGAPAAEIRSVFVGFPSSSFYPSKLWSTNYLGALAGSTTRLLLTPAQFQADGTGLGTGTLRRFSDLQLRLFYSNNVARYGANIPALADAPAISGVAARSSAGNITFRANATGDPAAGIQAVWVTYTAVNGPLAGRWQSLDLSQDQRDSTLWSGTLPLAGTPSTDIRYIVQAVNGVGLVTLDDNLGIYYTPDFVESDAPTTRPVTTTLALVSPPTLGAYGSTVLLRARLASAGAPLAGKAVTFSLGAQNGRATTDATGTATFSMTLLSDPGSYEIGAAYRGNTSEAPASAASASFRITQQTTNITITPAIARVQRNSDSEIVAELRDGDGSPLSYQAVIFIVTGSNGTYYDRIATDFAGRARLGTVPLGIGTYTVSVIFADRITLANATLDLTNPRFIRSTASSTLEIQGPRLLLPAVMR